MMSNAVSGLLTDSDDQLRSSSTSRTTSTNFYWGFFYIMQSLRTRRPSEARAVKRQASKLEKKPINKNVRKSTVDDKIKKRMSLRYAEISAPTEASVPDVPSVPIGLRPGAVRDPDELVLERANIREDPKAIDQRLLDKEDFDPDACGYCAYAV
jgi:hypothetical protein